MIFVSDSCASRALSRVVCTRRCHGLCAVRACCTRRRRAVRPHRHAICVCCARCRVVRVRRHLHMPSARCFAQCCTSSRVIHMCRARRFLACRAAFAHIARCPRAIVDRLLIITHVGLINYLFNHRLLK